MAGRYRVGLFDRQAMGVRMRQLGLARTLIDICGIDDIGLDADLPEQIEPPRRSRSQNQSVGQPVRHAGVRIATNGLI
jgi:hypothetical protein